MSNRTVTLSLTGLLLTAGCCLFLEHSSAQDTAPPFRGVLYRNWSKLGLTDEQVNKIYKVQGDHRIKIRELTKQIIELKKQEKWQQLKC